MEQRQCFKSISSKRTNAHTDWLIEDAIVNMLNRDTPTGEDSKSNTRVVETERNGGATLTSHKVLLCGAYSLCRRVGLLRMVYIHCLKL